MADFLSRAWIVELDAAARACTQLAAIADRGPLVVEQRVTGGPDGDCSYHVIIDGGDARVNDGPADHPNLRFITDYPTAVALHRGEINAQLALASDRMRVHGALDELVVHQETLRAIDDVFAVVRERTTIRP